MKTTKTVNVVLLLSFLFILVNSEITLARSQQVEFPGISEGTIISLITISPGNQLYTRFGHSAIRIKDPESGLDIVYNYGTFDFDTPGFYTKFLRGKLLYFLSVYNFDRMVRTYQYFNQSMVEQELDLTFAEKLAVYDFLNQNYLPENRYYLYDFFYDNCSSRIRDVFQDILQDQLYFENDFIGENKSFRQLLDEYLYVAPWEDFGIDIILGLPADKVASASQYMYLPEKMYDAFGHATIKDSSGDKSFVQNTTVIFTASADSPKMKLFTPDNVFWSLFIILFFMSAWQVYRNRSNLAIDLTLFLIMALAGMLIGLLWFATDHIATKDNFNIIWLFPGHIIMVPLILLRNRFATMANYYFILVIVSNLLMLIFWRIIPQLLHSAFIPIMLMAITRSLVILIQNKKRYVAGKK